MMDQEAWITEIQQPQNRAEISACKMQWLGSETLNMIGQKQYQPSLRHESRAARCYGLGDRFVLAILEMLRNRFRYVPTGNHREHLQESLRSS